MLTRADWIVVAGALVLLPALYGHFWFGGNGDTVEIRVENHAPIRVPLDKNTRITVTGRLGPTTIEIRDGRARFVSAPCNGKFCILSGWHDHGGDVAACLPNQVSLDIASLHRAYDAINY
jgi:hypothetical protein